jgi:hypothetical protein
VSQEVHICLFYPRLAPSLPNTTTSYYFIRCIVQCALIGSFLRMSNVRTIIKGNFNMRSTAIEKKTFSLKHIIIVRREYRIIEFCSTKHLNGKSIDID